MFFHSTQQGQLLYPFNCELTLIFPEKIQYIVTPGCFIFTTSVNLAVITPFNVTLNAGFSVGGPASSRFSEKLSRGMNAEHDLVGHMVIWCGHTHSTYIVPVCCSLHVIEDEAIETMVSP